MSDAQRLDSSKLNWPNQAQQVPGDLYLVGGAVRDQLLGRPNEDRDWLVVGCDPEAMHAQGFKPVGQDFPVFLHPHSGEEYALARTERKSGRGYGGFSFHAAADVSLEQDLQRRDLTINALAADEDGRIVDPYGGLQDLKDKYLRHVSPAFSEDPLRVLRVARFAARFAPLGFRIHPDTLQLMHNMAESGELSDLVAERVWQETSRALMEDHASIYFSSLRDCGALAVLFPELDRLFGIPQPKKYHPEIDCGIHTLLALDQACQLSKDLAVRFSVLCHDLGKGTTNPCILPSHRGHEQRGVPLIEELAKRLKPPKALTQLACAVAANHLLCHKAFELRPDTVYKLFEQLDCFRRPERLQQFLLCCEADARGRTGLEEQAYPQPEYLLTLFEATQSVTPKDLIARGFQGAELGAAIKKARVMSIKRAKDQYETP